MNKTLGMLSLKEKLEDCRVRHEVVALLGKWYIPQLVSKFPKYKNQKVRVRNYVNGKIFSSEIQKDFIELMDNIKTD